MAVTLAQLDKTLQVWKANFEKNSLAARKRSAGVFIDAVVDGTPQDTGKTVSNWQTGLGTVPQTGRGPFIERNRNGNRVATKANNKDMIRKAKRVDAIVIANTNPDVMLLLEAGFSRQAPGGNIIANAVARALREYRTIDSYFEGKVDIGF